METIREIDAIVREANLEECLKLMSPDPVKEFIRLSHLSNGNQTIRICDETTPVWEYLRKHPRRSYLPLVKCPEEPSSRIPPTGDYLVAIRLAAPLSEKLSLKFVLTTDSGKKLSTVELNVPRETDLIPLDQLPWWYKTRTLHTFNELYVENLPSGAEVFMMILNPTCRDSLLSLTKDTKLTKGSENLSINMKLGIQAVRMVESLIEKANVEQCLEVAGKLENQIPLTVFLTKDNCSFHPVSGFPQLEARYDEITKDVREYFEKNPGKPYLLMGKLHRQRNIVYRLVDFLVGIKFDPPAPESSIVTFMLVGSFDRVLSTVDFVIEKGTSFFPLDRLPWHYKAVCVQIYSRIFYKGLPSTGSLVGIHLSNKLRSEICGMSEAPELYRPAENLCFDITDYC